MITKQDIFGEMIRLSRNIIKGYHSDLYHDVCALVIMGEKDTFIWGVREYGTHILRYTDNEHKKEYLEKLPLLSHEDCIWYDVDMSTGVFTKLDTITKK